MHSYSRSDRLETELYQLAESGIFISVNRFMLYKSEIRKLHKQGFSINPVADSKKAVYCTIDWSFPFNGNPPMIITSYVNRKINTFPEGLNFAQKLYVIAARKNNE